MVCIVALKPNITMHILTQSWIGNLLFISVQLLAIVAYFSIKEGRLINPFHAHLGLGDVLYFFAVSLAFHLHEFIWYITTGLIFTLVSYALLQCHQRFRSSSIPLAAFMSIWFLLFYYLNISTAGLFNPDDHELILNAHG